MVIPPLISSIADKSSVLDEGLAVLSEIKDIPLMREMQWRKRLAFAVEASGKSKREISLAAGLGAGYVHSILSEGKDPTIERLLKVCEATGVSLTHVIYGFNVSPEDEEFLRLISEAPEQERLAVLALLRSRNASTE
jgi:transcriptional regulator with XRE-family HTH domain